MVKLAPSVPSGALSHDEFLAMPRLPGLDGLRALAALAVVFFHFGGTNWDRLQGWLGVQLFFTLSGFLITTLLLREEHISLRGFYRRRAFRILPVYVLVLGLTVLSVSVAGRFSSSRLAEALPHYLLFGNELVDYDTPFGVSWSLGVEEKFYLLWPLVLVLTAKAPGRRIPLTLAGIAALLAASAWSSLTLHYVSILLGCLLALTLHRPRGFAALRWLTRPWVAAGVALAFAGFQYGLVPLRDALGGGWQELVPVYALAVAVLIPAVLARGPVRTLLESRPMVYIGRRSYALYLCQTMSAAIVSTFVPGRGTGQAVLVALVSLGMAALMYRWIERPATRCGRTAAH